MATVSVRVDAAAIQGLFEESGQIGRFGQRVNNLAYARAKIIAPKRSGRLAGSITKSPAVAAYGYKVTIGSSLKYAPFVNDGTKGPILPKRGQWLAVGKDHGEKHIYKREVRGQRGQHFLESGINQAFAGVGIFIHV